MFHILTLNWNGADKLSALYPTLIDNLKEINYQWYIKDNGSTDNSIEVIKNFNNTQLLSIDHNRDSFSLGMNKLFQFANPQDEDIILLLNNDIVFEDDQSISNMLKLINHPKVGVVGAKLTYPKSTLIQHTGVVFTPSHNLPSHYKAKQSVTKNELLNREFQAVTGAVWMTKAKYYKDICTTNQSNLPGLDEKYIWMYEDIDACLSIKYKQHKKVVYCGQTNISHEESASLKKNPMNQIFLMQNINYFLSKWKGIYSIDYQNYNNPKHLLFS